MRSAGNRRRRSVVVSVYISRSSIRPESGFYAKVGEGVEHPEPHRSAM
jgi:hypothetical protein